MSHNIYVGTAGKLTVTNSFFHEARIGHNLKSRARENRIENSYFMDGPAGTSSYLADFPNGGAVYLRGASRLWLGPGDDGTITVQSNGQFSSTTSVGCAITGTATPRPSGKNVFNISVTFGPTPCLLPNGTASGVAVITHPTATSSELSVLVTTAARDHAAAFFGSR